MDHMGQFTVRGRLTGPTGVREDVDLLVDTGSTLLVVSRSLADQLDLVQQRMETVWRAGDQEATWPVAEVRLALGDKHVTTPCMIAPRGPALLGAVALESLFLAVDPVGKRLVPVHGYVLANR